MFGKKAQANLKESNSRIERLNMFKKKEKTSQNITPQYKSTDELLCIYRQRAIDAMIEVMHHLETAGGHDSVLLVSPITDYVQALEILVASMPKDFYPTAWLKQQTGQLFPPVRVTPWLNIQ